MKKKLLILTGPQGSGNHLMSKVFSVHPEVSGWEELLESYWIGHDEEFFAPYWSGEKELIPSLFEGKKYWVTSISVPFINDGVEVIPAMLAFIKKVQSFDIDVVLGVIVRDQNIVRHQQKRVREKVTLPLAIELYSDLMDQSPCPIHFLDFEGLYLYKSHWLRWISTLLAFPVAYDHPKILEILSSDSNQKYVSFVDDYWLDQEVKKACTPKNLRKS
ncbi:MAG: hypothetical protein WC635_05920 [Bacteriovorax sp.]|jgi:hypothetical protein